MERLQKIIANFGYCSRRRAEQYIEEGKVLVNGKKITELGYKASLDDVISVNGQILHKEEKEYILLYKPRGIITSSKDEKGRKTVVDLIQTKNRIYPVGRLDYDTSGLLLLTNDGVLANLLMHPKTHIPKTYIAKVKGLVFPDIVKKLCSGVVIDGKKCGKAKAKVKRYDKKTNTSIVELTIYEGKNHQVKKMFESLGYPVLKLKRELYSFLTLDGLHPGEYRNLTVKEVKKLYNEVKMK